MSKNLLPLLAQRVFNAPMMMRASDLSAIAMALHDRFHIEASEVQALANTGQYQKRKAYQVTKEGWAIVPVIGGLAHRAGKIDADCMPITSYELIRHDYDTALNDPEVKLIVMEFDSGGGEAAGCFDLARHILSTRGKKPVIAFVNESCYSAAYALACCCDQVYLTSSAGAGSIGVICGRLDQTEYNRKMGLSIELFVSGDYKADFSPHKVLSDDERQRLQALIVQLGSEFHNLVAEARGMTAEQVKALKAGCFTGRVAVDNGLADGVMSQDEFYSYLLNEQESDMFFGKGKDKDQGTQASYTQAQMDEAVKSAKAEATQALAADAANATKQAVTEAVQDYQKNTEARLKGIFDACATVGRPDMAGELMLSDLSLEQAQEQLFAKMADEGEELQNHTTDPEANGQSRNYLLEMCQAAAKNAVES
ncbi:S49 family peptidase [Microbacteriaceae bacterium 4G12]